ncbi:hypothetical protein HJD18_12800 [Thermoleophilia bacterium SCSIO 60948]|nr:hypothetical protein HJD18_12800 [Thermoleophilia bacterium SCSIO 60948]
MISVLAMFGVALACLVVSAALGAGICALLGWRDAGPICAPIGFAALIAFSALAIRLPGRAVTLLVLIAILALAGLLIARARGFGVGRVRGEIGVAITAVVLLLLIGAAPFAIDGHLGVLGEGVYTNDHAAQLYWTDWLQNGFGPEPSAVSFGYPTGPQSLTAALAELFGANLIDAFNGVMLAIGALTALGALSALRPLHPAPRLLAAVLVGLPYLAASYLAQSAFKETAMAMIVVCLAIVLTALGRGAPRLAVAGVIVVLAAGAVFAYSVPGLAWFVVAIPIWLVAEALFGERVSVDWRRVGGAVRSRTGLLVGAGALIVVALVVVLAGPQIASFAERIGAVQESRGRLASPVWPGEALGVWFEGDFRIVRGEVPLAYPATLLGLVVAALGAWFAFRRRDLGLLAVLAGCAAIYLGSYLFASIYVAAKALAILAPVVMLAGLLALFGPSGSMGRGPRVGRLALAAVFCVAALYSTFLALREAPVGFNERGEDLEAIAAEIEGEPVVFLGVDRFGSYRLRGTLAESPGGYFEPEVPAREQKLWQQGDPVDFDTVSPARIDRFRYAITPNGAYASTPPDNWDQIGEQGDWLLWERNGPTEPQEVLNEGGAAGRELICPPNQNGEEEADEIAAEAGSELTVEVDQPPPGLRETEGGEEADALIEKLFEGSRGATTLPLPVLANRGGWARNSPFAAPGETARSIELYPGEWDISLQYASQVPITVKVGDEVTELPPSLGGMYLTEKGGGSFWDVGRIEVDSPTGDDIRAIAKGEDDVDLGEQVRIEVTSAEPEGLAGAVGARRLTWLGAVAATQVDSTEGGERPLSLSCGAYIDHFDPPTAETTP